MARHLGIIALIPFASGCAGVQLSNVDDGRSLEYRAAIPAITVSQDAECKVTSQVVSIPGAPRYMSFRSGLGKAETAVDFGPGGTITKFNSKTEGQVDDALKIANAVLGAVGGPAGMVSGAPGKCKPSTQTYLIEYVNGVPQAASKPIFKKEFD